MEHKRAVSPLIATVLLIAFAVALGAVVMNWAAPSSGDSSTSKECSEVGIILREVDEEPQICATLADRNVIEVLVTNVGSTEITALKFDMLDGSRDPIRDTEPIEHYTIPPTDTGKIVHFFSGNVDKVVNVRITPFILSGEEEVSCSSRAIEANNIKEC